jgi:ATP-dependent protease HslVU (ClpYQ) peptidase subunit
MTWVIGRHLPNKAISIISDIQITYKDGSRPPSDCLLKLYRITNNARIIVAFAGDVENCFILLDDLAAYLNVLNEKKNPTL